MLDGDISGIERTPEVVPARTSIDLDDDLDAIFGSADESDPPGAQIEQVERGIAALETTAGGSPAQTRRYWLVKNGLRFEPGVTLEAWVRDVEGLIAVKRGIDWALADALAFGEDAFGEAASQVFDATPFAAQTLLNLASIARRIPPELRNDQLPFTVQAEVAPLSYEDQKAILEEAAAEGLKREEVRDKVRATKRLRQRERAEALPEPARTPPNITIECADAQTLPWPDGSVNLIVTSPPYGIQDGPKGVRKYRTPDDWQSWADLMDSFMEEAERVLAPGGRLAINVPFDTWVGGENGGQRNTYGRTLLAGQVCNLTYVTTICWDEGNISKSAARGSVDSPTAPRVINRQEAILVFCKGQYGRLEEAKAKNLTTDLTHDEWLAWTDGTWAIPGESNPWEGFEAAFPWEIPYRLIKLFSFQQDVICDPFNGSGTSSAVAFKLGRAGRFSDLDPQQVASAKRRLLSLS